jgi:hypothetical protein
MGSPPKAQLPHHICHIPVSVLIFDPGQHLYAVRLLVRDPFGIPGHKLGTLDTIDQRYVDAHRYFRGLLEKLDCYSGHKAL